jgi:hypothetical protein
VARATPAKGSLLKPFNAESSPSPAINVAALSSPKPAAAITPAPTPEIAEATPPPARPELKPFLVSSPTPGMALNTGASWRTYAPGQMPRGRLLNLNDATDLADRGTGGERLYLQGNFYVTASGENRAVLRPNGGALGSMLNVISKSNARVIVEYPAGSQPPPVKASFSRSEMRPFEIRDIRRGPDGQVNIFVREVTTQ